jgi:hypothetical protein
MPKTIGYYSKVDDFINIAALLMSVTGGFTVVAMLRAPPKSSEAISEVGAWLVFLGDVIWILYSLMYRSTPSFATSVGGAITYMCVILLKYKYGTGGCGWATCYRRKHLCHRIPDDSLLWCGGWRCCRTEESPRGPLCACCDRVVVFAKLPTSDAEEDDDDFDQLVETDKTTTITSSSTEHRYRQHNTAYALVRK